MKAIMTLLAALTLATPFQVAAADGHVVAGKDRCLLYTENCPEQGDTILESIAKLQKEIARGATVYTSGEIVRLESKLEEYHGIFDSLMSGGGGD